MQYAVRSKPTLDRIRERLANSSAGADGEWFVIDDERMWVLFADGEPGVSPQILKAPKTGTPYAEYWPNQADTDFIVHAKSDIHYLLQEVERLNKLLESK